MRPCISKEAITKKGGRVAQGVGPEFKPQNCKKEKRGEGGEVASPR
jgi:hypothetical protein